ncbi:hypothetical protein AALB47_13615 [Lachnospiraceae bacterium 54-11]|jgi:hypothetical protein|nr:hypothetical protein [Lachnospiraceae bacterium]
MRIIAVLDVDEEKLVRTGHSFEEEMGWAAESGITLTSYTDAEKCSTYEYAAFAWNKEKEEYAQIGRDVTTEQLCRNRFKERVEKRQLAPCYDSGNVIYKKRSISELHGDWAGLE